MSEFGFRIKNDCGSMRIRIPFYARYSYIALCLCACSSVAEPPLYYAAPEVQGPGAKSGSW